MDDFRRDYFANRASNPTIYSTAVWSPKRMVDFTWRLQATTSLSYINTVTLGKIHREFIGTPTHLKEQLQEEFFTAKCCSLRKRDLAKHFERQTRRYYALNGLNNPSLKQVYLSSIDEYLSQQNKATHSRPRSNS